MAESSDKPVRLVLSGMRIPVFISGPTDLSPDQDEVRNAIKEMLNDEMLEPRALGRTDYPLSLPLAEVCVIASHCAGGIILGFEQLRVTAGTRKHGARKDDGKDASRAITSEQMTRLPTAWNHMEAAILFTLGKPLMIMCEQGIDEGVFFPGTASSFTHTLPANLKEFAAQRDPIRQVIKSWRARVSATYKNVWSFADRYMQ
jgi:hypothetical protein